MAYNEKQSKETTIKNCQFLWYIFQLFVLWNLFYIN